MGYWLGQGRVFNLGNAAGLPPFLTLIGGVGMQVVELGDVVHSGGWARRYWPLVFNERNVCSRCQHFLPETGNAMNQCGAPDVVEGIKALAGGPVSVCIDIARAPKIGKCGPLAMHFDEQEMAA